MLLTEREKNVVRLILEGHSNLQIAENLGIKINTVKAFKTRILGKYRKFGIRNYRELTVAFENLKKKDLEPASERVNNKPAPKLRLEPR